MRVERVAVNETCNQNCPFCHVRRPRERVALVARDAVHRRIAACAEAGVQEVVLTGGEPTLRSDLAALVRHAKRQGVEVVTVETNGALLDAERLRELSRAGLDCLRVHVPAWGEACDVITRDRGGFARTRLAMHEACRARLRLQVSIPVVCDNLLHVEEIPDAMGREDLAVELLLLVAIQDARQGASVASLDQTTRAIEAVAAVAQPLGFAVQLYPGTLLPPCAFREPDRVAHLFTLTPGGAEQSGYRRTGGCTRCQVGDRCPGVPEAVLRREPFEPRPIESDRTRRRLSVLDSVQEQVRRELVSHELYLTRAGEWAPASVVRTNFRCNQACRFCFVSTHLPAAPEAEVRSAIVEIAERGGALVLSGGEPTLNPRLADYVRLGRARGARWIELQTNAIRLAEPERVNELVDAGLDATFVSLLAATPEVSDALTCAPGTFVQTVAGIDRIAQSPLRLGLNFVLCEPNQREFPRTVAMVHERWPSAELTLSFVAPGTDLVPRSPDLVPRYSDVLPSLRQGLELARALGLRVQGFDSMCGLPVCLLRTLPVDLEALPELPEDLAGGEFLRPDPCGRCARRRQCWGLRRNYADLHGTGELVAFE